MLLRALDAKIVDELYLNWQKMSILQREIYSKVSVIKEMRDYYL